MKQKLLSLFFVLTCLVGVTFAQNRQVSGRVTSAGDGSPLSGVSVAIVGTSNATQTDGSGNYSIQVLGNDASLVFSYVGFNSQRIAVGSRSVVNVQLVSDEETLDEVVVTGYSTVSKLKSTIATSVVDAEALNNTTLPDVNQMLQGNASGVTASANSGQPGSRTEVRIRGIGSISASSSPLYVLDGVIMTNGDLTQNTPTQDVISSLNPADIENITVLKDAAATAIYGARGANGVIVITTKSGQAGQSNITLNAKFGGGDVAGKIDLMNSSQLLSYQRELMRTAGMSESDILERRPDMLAGNNTNWYDEAFQSTKNQTYNLSASGGNEKTQYFGSGEYFDQKGGLVGSHFKRYGARLNVDHKLSDKFDLSFKLNGSYTDQRSANAGNGYASPLLQMFFNTPYVPAYNADGSLSDGFSSGQPGTSGYAPFGNIPATYRPTLMGGNFMHTIEHDYNFNNNLYNSFNGAFGWNIIDGLRLVVRGNAEMINVEERVWWDPIGYNGRNYDGLLQNSNVKNTNLLTNQLLTYNKTFEGGHSLNLLLGNEFQKNDYRWTYMASQGFASSELQQPGVAAKPLDVDGDREQFAFHSVFLNANYDFDAKYFVGASIRRDGSSRFPKDSRYGTFYSGSAAWLISSEQFLENVSWINSLKLRTSYGRMGNADFLFTNRNYPFNALYRFDAVYNDESAAIASQVANPGFTWEKTKMFDVGIDFALFNGYLDGSVEFFDKRSEALILQAPLSGTTGFSTINSNIGSILNQGWEVTLGSTPIKNENFSWNISGNFSTLKNEVLSLVNDNPITPASNTNQRIEVGHSIASWYMQEWAGVNPDNGAPQWYDADGNLTSTYSQAARRYVGTALPKITGGLTNRLSYKDIDLSFLISFSAGNKALNRTRQYWENDGNSPNYNFGVDAVNRWQNPGDISDKPKAEWNNGSLSNSISTRYLEYLDYARLRNVRLGYNLPKTVLEKIRASQIKIYAQAENLITLTGYKGFDPDVNTAPLVPTSTSSVAVANSGVDFFRYPTAKIITFGVTASF
ncbi:SusC/RagA family TonB-linked outer membrane protein [Sphingobacterium chuzhouense]|uniref:TonB-dependent receptor n=1 Tax=Sphingobacterium chuzhouense TaxID=1742264 RepID=A0ABR7XW34_9SPHI|nr:TonB-dependent receptor [Sphingobacterium chuzhouense]MBD1423255.1 TonB-dependent receptor [Sphingobacterium chuzhouense]